MNYRELLDLEFVRRRNLNQSYSLRAFARDLGLLPSHLTEVLGKKKGLSAKKAKEICRRLKLSGADQERFVNCVDREHARNPQARRSAERALRMLAPRSGFDEMSLSDFRKVSTWVALAILELVEIPGVDASFAGLAQRLGVAVADVRSAVSALLSVQYLKKTAKGYRPSKAHQATPSFQSSQVIRDFHQTVLRQAGLKLESVVPEKREFSSLIFSIDPERMPEAKKWLAEFRWEFSTSLESKTEGSQVHCLSMQFFPLESDFKSNLTTKEEKKQKSEMKL